MATVYLETSFISACVTTRTDIQSLARRQTSTQWMNTQAARHELFVSPEVLRELSSPSFPNRHEALTIVSNVPQLIMTPEVIDFAELLVKNKVMPGPLAGDAIHVAIAAVHRIEYMLSWNVRHLANVSKRVHLQVICTNVGLAAPQIVVPSVLWSFEDE